MLRAIFLLLTIVPLFAQFGGLSTTNDGSQLYFSSSLQLNGSTGENSDGKIFRYDSSGLHFVAQVDRVAVKNAYPRLSNPYNLVFSYISGDGRVTGYVGSADCAGFQFCISVPGVSQTALQYPGTLFPTVLPYRCVITGNARYAACAKVDGVNYTQYEVFDLFASTASLIYTPGCNEGGSGIPAILSSDGHFLCENTLWSASGPTTLNLQGYGGLLSDDGSRIVTSSVTSFNIYDVATGIQSTVALPNVVNALATFINNNGKVILFVLGSGPSFQLAVIHADGTGFLQLTNDPAGANIGILSGDGSTAFVVTNSGKLLKIDTTSGASTLIASAAQVQQVLGAPVAGSPVTITGTGLADVTAVASAVPLTTSLGGVQIAVNGVPAPLYSVSPASIEFQIPWETPLGSASIAVVRPSSPFMAPAATLRIVNFQPFAPLDYALSQNFTPLNGATAANPGDFVTFYLTGLGPVTVPVADGVASPSNPLSLLASPVTVSVGSQPGFGKYTGPAQLSVLYAGLAPGLVGIYQLTLQLPAQIPHNGLLPNQEPFYLTLNSSFNLPPVLVFPNQ